jgi:phage terminase small subunit
MAALPTDKQRGFVVSLFLAPRKRGALIYAARAAGYGTDSSSNKSLGVMAARLLADDRVQAAIAEESHKRLRGLAPSAISAVEKLVNNSAHKDHARALDMVLSRADPVTTSHTVHVSDGRSSARAEMEMGKVLQRIEELWERVGAPALPRPIIIDAEAVPAGSAAA